ncbi:hypothetical protein RI129_011030 [Pyrocoelia pectoralis]|uniref:Uncharacterized protein n=1 Tax=Pyrocoelia pectoralis TaxID=417401 RepID=A0AAN7VB97_9COLE
MKVIYLLVCLPALLAQPTPEDIKKEWRELIAPYEELCANESGADIAVIRETWDTFVFSHDPAFKCYIWCIYENIPYLYPNGTINIEAVIGSVDGVTNEVIEKCIEPYGTCPDKCHGFWAFDHCLSDVLNLTTVKLDAPPCSVRK